VTPERRPPTNPDPRAPDGAAARVPFVGLTGGLGAGKSTALGALDRLGAATLSTDAVVHELYASGEVRDAVVARWGEAVAPGGVVDRAAVARRAFGAPAERAWLEGLLWPLVAARVASWREEAERRVPRPRAAVVETPLLFEAGMEGLYDATIAVVAEEAVRVERAAERGHQAVDERAARQLSQQEKAARATYVVANSGTVEDLELALADVLAKLDPLPEGPLEHQR
jgi:dephospho-CoA kinase